MPISHLFPQLNLSNIVTLECLIIMNVQLLFMGYFVALCTSPLTLGLIYAADTFPVSDTVHNITINGNPFQAKVLRPGKVKKYVKMLRFVHRRASPYFGCGYVPSYVRTFWTSLLPHLHALNLIEFS